MIRVYTVSESNEIQTKDVYSLKEIRDVSNRADWFWADFSDPTEKEFEAIVGLVKETKAIEEIKEQKILSAPERFGNLHLLSIPQAVYNDRLTTFPIYVLTRDAMLITVRNKHSSRCVKSALSTFEDCVGEVCRGPVNSSFILTRLFHEISNENLDEVMVLKERIDRIEEKALVNPTDKRISRSVFKKKRELSKLERILWSQRELMLRVSEGVMPMIKTTEEIKATLSHPINNISRELSLLESHNDVLDSILSLQNLGMIHRVERNLIYLTIMALIVSVLLIIIEVDIVGLLLR